MDSPEERVKIAFRESERLKEYLSSLPTEAWNKPSACDLWEVRDVVAHLAGTAEAYTERIYKSLQGDSSPPADRPDAGTVNGTSYAKVSAERYISRREGLGDQVFSDFNKTKDQLNQLLTTLGPQDWDKPHYYVSIGIAPMGYRPTLWISELVMHGWDIRSAFDPEAHLSDENLPVLMDLIFYPRMLTGWMFNPGPRPRAPIRYRWELTGAGASNSDIVVEGDKASVEPAGTGKADVNFHCDTETFVLIAFGRLTTDTAVTAHRLTIQGDHGLALEFQRWFPGS